MTEALAFISLICRLYLAWFFLRSAYRKVKSFDHISAEFQGWGYPFPRQVTFFLIAVWLWSAPALLIPISVGPAAIVLLAIMLVAAATLLFHGEYRRMIEPAVPIALLAIVAALHLQEITIAG